MRVLVAFSFCQAMTILVEYQYIHQREGARLYSKNRQVHNLKAREKKRKRDLQISIEHCK